MDRRNMTVRPNGETVTHCANAEVTIFSEDCFFEIRNRSVIHTTFQNFPAYQDQRSAASYFIQSRSLPFRSVTVCLIE